MEDTKPILLSDSNNLKKQEERTITITEIADKVDSRAVQLTTKKRRIRQIIKNQHIKYKNSAKNGWLINEIDAEKIKKIYVQQWKPASVSNDPIENENHTLKQVITEKDNTISELQRKINDLTVQNSDLKKTKEKLEEENFQNTASLRKSVADQNQLQAREQALEANQQELTHNALNTNTLQLELTDAKNQVIKRQEDIIRQKDSLNDKDKEIADLKLEREKLMSRGLFARLFNKKV